MTIERADLIVVGGGTAGLTLAEKLSRNSAITILVLEAGSNCIGHAATRNVDTYFENLGSERDWAYESLPQAGLNGKTTVQNAGKLLGGSSAINGGYYVPPSRAGADAWAELGNGDWTASTLRESCQAMINYNPPDPGICRAMGVELAPDEAATNGPIALSARLASHPVTEGYFAALKGLAYKPTTALFNHHSAAAQVLTYTEDPTSHRRSSAEAVYGAILAARPNVTIATNAAVHRVILDGSPPNVRAAGVEFTSHGTMTKAFANKEVILSAGALSSPRILERSGIGATARLKDHGIPIVIDNSFVGERLRNHLMVMVHCELSKTVPPAAGMSAMAFMSSCYDP